ncbi:leucine-rich repeat domain-containing protein [Flavobacterium piscisymbiosum]|uniref:Leucine-rich repeat domain-containing protein n=1 Tax=Flavobacterium piscisymbiosum TaxID=2893753 RepID=A0ABS8MLL7_9FLAO|nr:hypothetical protein [Flavobacterium sp. F-30]MCC9066388.1 hypothetical protein [Flavobacterium sp. F-30]
MSTNHNRIKVSDLETSQHDKILKTNMKGELEFSDVSTLKTENYNALDCTSEGKALDARQGKVLKDMIENNNFNLASDSETQITNSVTEDNKVVSRSKLFNWWNWVVAQTQIIKAVWNFSKGLKVSDSTSNYTTEMLQNMFVAKLNQVNNGVCKAEYGFETVKWSTANGYSTLLKPIAPNQNRTLTLPNKSGTISIVNDFVKTAAGTITTPSLIIPNGSLTTTPQNGAIERDENGQLWETHAEIRSKLGSGSSGIELKGEFNNSREALAANLKVGDYYSTPTHTINDTAYIAMTQNPGHLSLEFTSSKAFAAFGINNVNSIDDWNTFFTSKGSSNFTRVKVYGNLVVFSTNDAATIKTINLPNIQLTRIYFSYLLAITEIDLSNNHLTEIDLSTLSPILETLVLSNNLITKLNPYDTLPETLKKLILNNNKLSEFEPIKGLPNSLVELNLEENLLDAFGDNIEMPTNLKILNLNKNKIGSFSMVVPKFLETLLLSGNNLSDWESNSIHQTNLLLLDLSYNEFSHFYITGGLPDGIKTLKLSHNKMDDFLTSKQLPWALKRLELNDNDFVDFNPKYLAGDDLEIILLQNNKIVTFNPQSLNDTLHKLNLGNNKIVNFNPTLFPSEINTLNLENNPITSIGWNTNTNWINSLGIEEGILYAGNTVGSIDGTNTKSMLKDLSWTITKTPYPFL